MGDLISRNILIYELQKYFINNSIHKNDLAEVIANIPTVDAKLVVHGEWIEHKCAEEVGAWLISNFECSQCHMWNRNKRDFCPECGADMRKEVQE